MSVYSGILTSLAQLSAVALFLGIVLGGHLFLASGRRRVARVAAGRERLLIGGALAVSAISTGGSLYLSEVAHLTPCLLCWYQRIVMYPLVPILGVAWLRADSGVWRYALPLSVIGLFISAYHVTIQWLPVLDSGACGVGVPCAARYVLLYGFISIPTMAGAAFLLITTLLLSLPLTAERGEEPPATPRPFL